MMYVLAFILGAGLVVSCGSAESPAEYRPGPRPPVQEELPRGVDKFRDGDVICYTYFQRSISCVKL